MATWRRGAPFRRRCPAHPASSVSLQPPCGPTRRRTAFVSRIWPRRETSLSPFSRRLVSTSFPLLPPALTSPSATFDLILGDTLPCLNSGGFRILFPSFHLSFLFPSGYNYQNKQNRLDVSQRGEMAELKEGDEVIFMSML